MHAGRGYRFAAVLLILTLSTGRLLGESPSSRPNQSTYFAIPLVGRLGREITVEAVAEALAAADRSAASYVVFVIDSPGGNVEELDRILRLLATGRQRLAAALVKRADAAAAVLPHACHWVFVQSGGGRSALGLPPEDGLTEDQRLEMRKKIRDRFAEACALGGRPVLPAMAMVDAEVSYYGDGVGRIGHGPRDAGWTLVKPVGERLEITERNAIACGYADGVCDGAMQMAVKMGISNGWRSAGEAGVQIMQAAAERYRAERARSAYYRAHREEIEQLQDRVRLLRGRMSAEAMNPTQRAEAESQLEETLRALEEHESRIR